MKTIEEKAKECVEELERLMNSRDLELYGVTKGRLRYKSEEYTYYVLWNSDLLGRDEYYFPKFVVRPYHGHDTGMWERSVERMWRLLGLGIKNEPWISKEKWDWWKNNI